MYAGACDVIHIVIHIAEPGKRERSESEKASGLIQASSLLPIAAQSQLQDQWRGECHAQAVAVFGVLPAPRPNRREQPPARHCVVGRLPRFLADTLPEMWAASIAAVARWEHAEGQERVAHAAEAHAVEVRHRGEPSTMQSWLYRW